MRKQAVRYLVLSQYVFVATILLCVGLEPGVLLDNTAMSVYGSIWPTAIPFAIGMLSVAFLFIRAARSLPRASQTDRRLSALFVGFAAIIIGLVCTPLFVNTFFYYAHAVLAMLLWALDLIGGAWLVRRAGREPVSMALYGLQYLGFVIAMLSTSEIGRLDLMAVAQLLVIFSFAALLMRAIPRIEHVERSV